MQKIKKEEGISMLSLVITIIVLAIIASIVIRYTINGAEYSKQKKLLSDLEVVQHAVYERYEQYKMTGNESFLVGKTATGTEMNTLKENSWEITNPSSKEENYYKLDKDSLKVIGINNSEDEYIVNYKTGECFNLSKKTINVDKKKHELYIK